MTQGSAIMPNATVASVCRMRDGDDSITMGKSGDHRDHLIMAQSMLKYKLIIANAGVCFPSFHNTVEDILAIVPLVKRQVIFAQFFWQRRQNHAIDALTEHGQHADSAGRKFDCTPCLQLFSEDGHEIVQPKILTVQGIHWHPVFPQNPPQQTLRCFRPHHTPSKGRRPRHSH